MNHAVESGNPDSKIRNLGDAFWWAIVTVTTVGYGDIYPVTTEGKIIASILMIIGIGVPGIFISTFGAALVESRLKMRKNDNNNNSDSEENEKHNKILPDSQVSKSKSSEEDHKT